MKGGDILDFSKWGNLRKGERVDYGIFVFVSCLESGAWLFSENSMKKFKEKIGLPSQKNEILGFFPWNFPK